MLLTILVFFLMLSLLVLIHEAGHYFVAKRLGIKVEEFGFGFPPRLFGKKIGETIYSLNALPIGGFVKLFGEDEAGGGKVGSVSDAALNAKGKELKRAYFARPAWQRFLVVVAGVVMNFFLAVVIISYLFAVQGVPTPGNKVFIAAIAKNSPAEKAGLKIGDQVLAVNSVAITSPDQLIRITKDHLGQKVMLSVLTQRSEKETVVITPRVTYPSSEGAMGVAIEVQEIITRYPWYIAPIIGIRETAASTIMIVQGLGAALVQFVSSGKAPQGVAGPIGIAQLTGQVVQIGPYAVLSLVAMLSLNLAVLNILPIPALDGGRLFFILYEMIVRRKVNPKFEGYAHAIGMAVLLALIVLITFHDVFRVVTHQSLIP